MGKIEDYKKILHNGKYYGVFKLTYKKKPLPVILDWQDFIIIKKMDKFWYMNEQGMVLCYNDDNSEVYLHELIMLFKCKRSGEELLRKPIIHINRLGIDDRSDNLLYDIVDKDINKNLKKKKRIIDLPPDSGISSEDLPTYVWYLKPNDSHGERFIIEIGGLSWKTSSSKTLSLKYKLEEAKKWLRQLKESSPALFSAYSMNGDFNKDGIKMLDSFYKIANSAGYKLGKIQHGGSTDKYLEEDLTGLDDEEIQLLHS